MTKKLRAQHVPRGSAEAITDHTHIHTYTHTHIHTYNSCNRTHTMIRSHCLGLTKALTGDYLVTTCALLVHFLGMFERGRAKLRLRAACGYLLFTPL